MTPAGGRINAALSGALGTPDGTDAYVAKVAMPWLYFHPPAMAGIAPDKLRTALQKFAEQEPGIEALFLSRDIERDDFAESGAVGLRKRVKNCYFPGRSGDLYVHVAENWYAGGHATGHGSAYPYNTHVPLLLFGRGVKPGKYDAPSAPTDLAPTLAKLLGIPPPSKATGRSLDEALKN